MDLKDSTTPFHNYEMKIFQQLAFECIKGEVNLKYLYLERTNHFYPRCILYYTHLYTDPDNAKG